MVLLFAFALTRPAIAQLDQAQPPIWRVECRPAPEPEIALRYVLLPPITERRRGNAAVHYNKLAIEFPPYGDEEMERRQSMIRWLGLPLRELPVEEIRAFLRRRQELIADLRLAACCESCDWESPIRDREFYSIRLPDVQAMNGLASLVALQARLHIKDGRFEDALPLLQTGFAMARHVSQRPGLMGAFVALAIAETMESRVFDWIRQPDAPNLYWALTLLPQPLVDLRAAAEAEARSLLLSFPELLELDDDTHTGEYWQDVLDRVVAYFMKYIGRDDTFEERLPLALLAVKQYPMAKRAIIDRGRSAEQVARLPPARVLLIDAVHAYRIESDRAFKRLYLPYDVLQNGTDRFDSFDVRAAETNCFLPLHLLLPAVEAYHFSGVRHERRIALLRIVEALRRYAAMRDNRLPERLGQEVGVPLPIDPVTGKPFDYRLDGQTGVIDASPPPGKSLREGGARIEIRLTP